jgi:intraflagellar transport protein 56
VSETVLQANVWFASGQSVRATGWIDRANEAFREVCSKIPLNETSTALQCYAASQFIDVRYARTLAVLEQIKERLSGIHEFNYNKGMTLALLGRSVESERYLFFVKNPKYIKEVFYTSWLCRCFVKNRKAENAWNLYLETEQVEDAKTLLQVIATDCYEEGVYYWAMLAYDVLAKWTGDDKFRE